MKPNTKNLRWNERDGVAFLTFPAFDGVPFLRHAFSTRIGGVSKGALSAMNLAFGRGDPREVVLENYRLFCRAAGFDVKTLVASAQDHHINIKRVTAADAGNGVCRPQAWRSVDGLVTCDPGVTLAIYMADCVPLLFCDPAARAIGAAHAGWRGTAAGMARAMVDAMGRAFGSRPQDLLVGVGPSIGPACYEVDEPVAEAFRAVEGVETHRFLTPNARGRYQLNLWEANRQILIASGVVPAHISVAELCTSCNSEWLFSHRASGGRRGGMAGFLRLLPGEGAARL